MRVLEIGIWLTRRARSVWDGMLFMLDWGDLIVEIMQKETKEVIDETGPSFPN